MQNYSAPKLVISNRTNLKSMRVILTIYFLLYSLVTLSAQKFETIIEEINFYADITANAGLSENRAIGNEKLILLIEEYLGSDKYSNEELDDIAYLSVKRPDDRSLTIITWQFIDHEDNHHYSGYIRTESGITHKLTSSEVSNPKSVVYDQLDKDSWYGALYYNLLTTELNGKKAYLLFGYDGHKGFEHRKVLDVLQMVDDEPVFGGELFVKNNDGQNRPVIHSRVLLEYSNDAHVSLNYNSGLGLITYDHLISRMGRNPGQGPTMVPDGSYMGYKWDGEFWTHIDKLYDQVSHVPPTDGKKRDANKTILGKDDVKRVKKKRG